MASERGPGPQPCRSRSRTLGLTASYFLVFLIVSSPPPQSAVRGRPKPGGRRRARAGEAEPSSSPPVRVNKSPGGARAGRVPGGRGDPGGAGVAQADRSPDGARVAVPKVGGGRTHPLGGVVLLHGSGGRGCGAQGRPRVGAQAVSGGSFPAGGWRRYPGVAAAPPSLRAPGRSPSL